MWILLLLAALLPWALLLTARLHLARQLASPWPFPADGRRVLLVTAHPDDEAMFFVPSLLALRASRPAAIRLLCLSDGGYEGIGDTRAQELRQAAAVLELDAKLLRSPLAQDGPWLWQHGPLADVIAEHLQEFAADVVLGFDAGGVSGHPNHVSTALALRLLAGRRRHAAVRFVQLHTLPLLAKYVPGLAAWVLHASPAVARTVLRLPVQPWAVLQPTGPALAHAAMRAHASQLTWFRRLYLAFSAYSHLNILSLVTPLSETAG
jgi:N-acetylglucosaminylphosphatidylinositol deacetylase